MTKQNLMLDLDDTLIHCNKYFYEVIERFSEQMEKWFSPLGFSPDEIKRRQAELDMAYVRKEGFKKNHFPQSLVDTYMYFSRKSGRPVRPGEANLLYEWGESVFRRRYEPYPQMEETLERLKDQGHDLYLYTGGDRHVQSEKIRQLRLDRYFGKNVFITRHKTEKVLDRLVDELGFHRPSTWMIGNSLKTDVVPALKAKIHSIYVPAALEWEFNITHVDVEPQGAFITVEALNEVPPAIHGYLNSSKNGAVGL